MDNNVLDYIYVGLRRKTDIDDAYISKDTEFDGIEEYIFAKTPAGRQFPVAVNDVRISRQELWQRAEQNTFKETKFGPVSTLVGDSDDNFLYVATNSACMFGASAILDPRVRKLAAVVMETDKIAMIPSSIHEVLLCPINRDEDLESLKEIIRSINDSEVLPEEVLGDHAYVIEV